MFLPISRIKLMLMGMSLLVVNVELFTGSTGILTQYNGKEVFGKEGKDVNLPWEYEIPYGNKVMELLFGEWMLPGYVSKKCFKVNENGKVLIAKNCEDKYDYKGVKDNRIYKFNATIYNLTKSDMKKYGIEIEMGIYWSPLHDWRELKPFVKAKITHFFISKNATVKEGDAVNITCRAAGGPEPNVTLYKEGQLIREGKGEVLHQIDKAAMEDAGEYGCVASNDKDEAADRRNITLSVRGAVKPPARGGSGSNKCFSQPWILAFLLFARWI